MEKAGRYTIGTYRQPWSFDQAREAALRMLAHVASGIDPLAEKKVKRGLATIAAFPASPVLGTIADTPAPHSRERQALPGAGDHPPRHSFQRSRRRLRFVDHISSCFARPAQLRESSLRTPLAV